MTGKKSEITINFLVKQN